MRNYDSDSWDEDNQDYWDNQTYDNYHGSYAQDNEGYSDQDIDEAFDGAPEAYWNID